MTTIAIEIQKLVDEDLPHLHALSGEVAAHKPLPHKWSKKELLGHLIDSAQNNIRRFIVTQYEENTTIVYKQDDWVLINDYQSWRLEELIRLWYLLNKQVIRILKNMDDRISQRHCLCPDAHTIEWLARDYIKHLKHHMHQLLEQEPVAYP